VGESARNRLGRHGAMALSAQPGRDAETGEPHVASVAAWFQCDDHVLRLEVLMDKTVLMELAERCRHANCNNEEPRHIQWLLPVPTENAVEGFAARIGENEKGPSLVACERQRF